MKPARMLALAFIAFAVGGPADAESNDIAIALSSNSFGTVPLRIAETLGLYGKHGLVVRLVTMENTSTAISGVISGSVQMAVAAPGEALAARGRGPPITIVANVYRGLSSTVVLAKSVADGLGVKSDAPVRDRLRALDGVSLAAPSPTAIIGLSVYMAIEATGAKPKPVYMSQLAMPSALKAGAIQAMVASSPFWLPAVRQGDGIEWIDCAKGELATAYTPSSSAMLQTTEAYAATNPDIVRQMRAVPMDVAHFVEDSPEQAQQILAKLYPEFGEASLSLAFAVEWPNWTKPLVSPDDIDQDIQVLKSSGKILKGMDTINPI